MDEVVEKIFQSIKDKNHSEFEKIISGLKPYKIGERVNQNLTKIDCKKNK
jgi:NAD-dependent DNA ligase